MASSTRQYSAARFALEIDGTAVGFASSVGGGEAFAQVIATPAPSGVIEKQPGGVEYAPIVIEVDTSLKKPFYDHITGFLDGSQKPMNGVVRFLDYNLTEQSRLEWTGGLIAEVAFPAADAANNKEAGSLRVTIQPEFTRRLDGSGATSGSVGPASHQKKWLPANFRFSITGLENAAKKVSKVEAIVLRRPTKGAPGSLTAGPLEVPDVVFTLATKESKPFYDWFEDFVVKGKNSPGDERTGSLVFLDPSLKTELIGLAMQHLGIFRVSEERQEQGSSAIARTKVELYCEEMALSPVPAQPATPATTPAGPAGGTQPTDSGLSGSIAAALLEALKMVAATDGRLADPMTRSGAVRGDVVAERLLSTVGPDVGTGPQPASTDLRRERGREIGTKWASTTATLDELAAASDLDGAEWSALVLAEGHSLIGFLLAERELREGETGPLELARDEFTEGLVAGAADVQRQAAPHLEGRVPRPELRKGG